MWLRVIKYVGLAAAIAAILLITTVRAVINLAMIGCKAVDRKIDELFDWMWDKE